MSCPDCARAEAQAAQADIEVHTLKLEASHRERVVASLKAKVADLEKAIRDAEKKKGKR